MMKKASHISQTVALEEISNVGPATRRDLSRLGISCPDDLRRADPKVLYDKLCQLDGLRHDPCVLDILMAACDFAQGNPSRHWSAFTSRRKALWPKT